MHTFYLLTFFFRTYFHIVQGVDMEHQYIHDYLLRPTEDDLEALEHLTLMRKLRSASIKLLAGIHSKKTVNSMSLLYPLYWVLEAYSRFQPPANSLVISSRSSKG